MRPDTNITETPISIDRAPDGAFIVQAVTPSGVVALGTYASVVDAWMAIDALDSPVEDLAQAA